MKNFLFFTLFSTANFVLFFSCMKDDRTVCSGYFPVKLINEATLYKVGESYTYAFVRNGVIYNEIIDSVNLTSKQWLDIIKIVSNDSYDAQIAVDCFVPGFIVMFKGGYHNYVSHLSISLTCDQIKYADNSGIHVISKAQKDAIKLWSEETGID